MTHTLSPAQQHALDSLLYSAPMGHLFVLYGSSGKGKTIVLNELHKKLGGVLLTMKDFVDAMRSQHPLALEETFERLLMDAFQDNDIVMVDDFHLLYGVICGCSGFDFYPRSKYIHGPMMALATYVAATGKKLFLSSQGSTDPAIEERCFRGKIDKFTSEDYAWLCKQYLTPACAEQFEYAKILYAYDRAKNNELCPVTEYFLRAVETVRTNKERYTQAEAQARMQQAQRSPRFMMPYMPSMEDGD